MSTDDHRLDDAPTSGEPDPAADENGENGESGLFGDWLGNSDIDADAEAPVQGDLFDDADGFAKSDR